MLLPSVVRERNDDDAVDDADDRNTLTQLSLTAADQANRLFMMSDRVG